MSILSGCRSIFAISLLLAASLAGAAPPAVPYSGALITGVPHVKQEPDFCGEACVAMWMTKAGHPVSQDWVFDQSGVDPALARGCYTAELARTLTRIGFQPGPVWTGLPGHDPAGLAEAFRGLVEDLGRGIPSIVCMRYDGTPDAPEHFRLVLGFDAEKDQVIYHEPAQAKGAYLRMARARFLRLWPLAIRDGTRTVI